LRLSGLKAIAGKSNLGYCSKVNASSHFKTIDPTMRAYKSIEVWFGE